MQRKNYRYVIHGETKNQGLTILARFVGALLGLAGLVLAFMFSVVLLAVAAVVILLLVAYFLWKTRHLRNNNRESSSDRIYEGESRRDDP